MTKNKSILFICPDYHCSFLYRDELRRLGWKADIYVSSEYPEKLLYSEQDILRAPKLNSNHSVSIYINFLLRSLYILLLLPRYKYHFYYGAINQIDFLENKLGLNEIFGDGFSLFLWLQKLFRRKVIHVGSGCLEEETRKNFSKLDDGNVCDNCGWGSVVCSDEKNITKFSSIRKYVDLSVGMGSLDSSQFRATHFKYKVIDLDLWHPNMDIPKQFKLPVTDNLRILHSFFKENRENDGLNIKGSPFVLDAIDRLKQEGHKLEYMYITDAPSKYMRYYQVQADIVVEQLIYGWWGSTFVETSSLGKPVICYLRPAWKRYFLKTFPEYDELPIVEANTKTIYDVLKNLVTDHEYREERGRKSRQFAKQHFDSKKNALAMAELLRKL